MATMLRLGLYGRIARGRAPLLEIALEQQAAIRPKCA